jgi:hypothetical protein
MPETLAGARFSVVCKLTQTTLIVIWNYALPQQSFVTHLDLHFDSVVLPILCFLSHEWLLFVFGRIFPVSSFHGAAVCH